MTAVSGRGNPVPTLMAWSNDFATFDRDWYIEYSMYQRRCADVTRYVKHPFYFVVFGVEIGIALISVANVARSSPATRLPLPLSRVALKM